MSNVQPAGPIPTHEQGFSGPRDFPRTKSKFISAHTVPRLSGKPGWHLRAHLILLSSRCWSFCVWLLFFFLSRLLSDHESLQLAPPDFCSSYSAPPIFTFTPRSPSSSPPALSDWPREQIKLALALLGTIIVGKLLTFTFGRLSAAPLLAWCLCKVPFFCERACRWKISGLYRLQPLCPISFFIFALRLTLLASVFCSYSLFFLHWSYIFVHFFCTFYALDLLLLSAAERRNSIALYMFTYIVVLPVNSLVPPEGSLKAILKYFIIIRILPRWVRWWTHLFLPCNRILMGSNDEL